MKLSARTEDRVHVLLQLAFAIAVTALIAFSWKPLKVRFPVLPGWSAGDLLAFLAISFAIVQFIDARRQERGMTKIAKSMSTRFIGFFPKNLKEITDVVGKSTRYLYVMVDFIGYGQYSDPESYNKYIQALDDALSRNVDVRIICYASVLRDAERSQQFPDDANSFAGKTDDKVFRKYFEVHKGVTPPTDNANLRVILNAREQANTEQLQVKGLKLQCFPEKAVFFLWLEDDEEAVFTFKNIGNKGRGFSFRTQDANLINQFKDIFERRWKTLVDQQATSSTAPAAPVPAVAPATTAPAAAAVAAIAPAAPATSGADSEKGPVTQTKPAAPAPPPPETGGGTGGK